MRVLFIFIAMLTIFSSCKKEEEPVDLCTNGFLDPGETAPDCGGDCPPCTVIQEEFFTVIIDGQQTTMNSHALIYNDPSWSLQMANDSLSLQISLGTSGTVATENITAAGTYCYLNGVEYPIQQNGIYSISDHDVSAQIMSGFFSIDFLLQISSTPAVFSTISITGGQFEFFSY